MEINSAGEKVYYADYTWRELDRMDRARVVLVMPSGSVEEHGPHLPLANDSIIANEIALRAAREVPDGLVYILREMERR